MKLYTTLHLRKWFEKQSIMTESMVALRITLLDYQRSTLQ